MANRCNLAPLKNFQIDRPKIHHIFPHPNLNRFLRFSFKLDNSAWTNIDRTKLETAHHRATAEMLKDDFPLASRFALGCDTIGNRCWQTDDDSVALSAAHPKSSSFPFSRSFISCFPPSVRKVHSDGSGQRAISMPVDQSPHPTAKLEKRWSVCVCVCVCNQRIYAYLWNPPNRPPIWRKCGRAVTTPSFCHVFPRKIFDIPMKLWLLII